MGRENAEIGLSASSSLAKRFDLSLSGLTMARDHVEQTLGRDEKLRGNLVAGRREPPGLTMKVKCVGVTPYFLVYFTRSPIYPSTY